MKVRELIAYSRRILKGRRRELLLVCILPVGAEIFFRLAEITVYSLLLWFGAVAPTELFTGTHGGQFLMAAVCTVSRWLAASPLWFAAARRLSGVAAGASTPPFTEILLEKGFIRRSITAVLWGKLFSLAAFVPVIVPAAWGWGLLRSGADSQALFFASNAAALSAAGLLLWLSVKLSLPAVPFIMAECSELGPFSAVWRSFRFMRGRKRVLVKLMAVYALPAISIVGLPFVLPELMTAFALGISIFQKEDEYSLMTA